MTFTSRRSPAERFATGSGGAAIITDAASLMAAIRGEDGTWIKAEQEAVLAKVSQQTGATKQEQKHVEKERRQLVREEEPGEPGSTV